MGLTVPRLIAGRHHPSMTEEWQGTQLLSYMAPMARAISSWVKWILLRVIPYIYIETHTHIHMYIYIYSHPQVDRIWYIFNPDFQKKVDGTFSKPQFLHVFSPVKVSFSQFWTRVWRNIEKTQK